MNKDNEDLKWSTGHVRAVIEAATRGAVSAAVEQNRTTPSQGFTIPPGPQIDAGELTIYLEDTTPNTPIGTVFTASSGSWVMEVLSNVDISKYFSASDPIRYGGFSNLSGNFITSVVILNQIEEPSSTGDAVMITYNESYQGSSPPTVNTSGITGSGWTEQVYTIHAGEESTYDGQDEVGVMYRRYHASTKRVVEQWFRAANFPTMTSSMHLWLVSAAESANSLIASLHTSNTTWQIRRYAYHMRTTTTPP